MEITLSTRQWAVIKRTAQNVAPNVAKKATIKRKMMELAEEYKLLDAQISGFEQGIKALCHGLGTEDLVHREVTVVEGRYDKDGKPLKKTSYESNPCVTYDEERNVYVVTVPDAPEAPETPAEEETASNGLNPETTETQD